MSTITNGYIQALIELELAESKNEYHVQFDIHIKGDWSLVLFQWLASEEEGYLTEELSLQINPPLVMKEFISRFIKKKIYKQIVN